MVLGADLGSVVQNLVKVFPGIEDVDFFVWRLFLAKEDPIMRGGEVGGEVLSERGCTASVVFGDFGSVFGRQSQQGHRHRHFCYPVGFELSVHTRKMGEKGFHKDFFFQVKKG